MSPHRRATLKERVRRLVSERAWTGSARLADAAFDALARALRVGMAVLPGDVRVQLRRRLESLEPLDYPDARILIRVSSRIERRLRLKSCEKEPETVEWLESMRDGDVLYDIGANIGAYSLIAACLPKRRVSVVAFEPGVSTYESLATNIAVNGLGDRILAVPVALADVTRVSPFEYASVEPGAARHPGILVTNASRTGSVLAYRLDDLVQQFALPAPTHVKLDVDGSELHVLRGAPCLLAVSTLRSVLVETAPSTPTGVETRQLLEGHGFVLQTTSRRGGSEVNWVFTR